MKIKNTIIAIVMSGLLVLGGCSLIGGGSGTFNVCTAVNDVQIQQVAVLTAANAIIGLNKVGVVPAKTLTQAQTIYNSWAQTQAVLVTSLTALNDAGGNPSNVSIQNYETVFGQLVVLAGDFVAVYGTLSSSPAVANAKADVASPTPTATPTPAVCTMTDAQITSALTVPTWAQLTGN